MALTGTVQKFENLPADAAVGANYKITGSADAGFTTYYVAKAADGTWNETVVPDVNSYIDPATMPHALVRQADGTFLFAPFTWQQRRVGDKVSNPDPTFIGRPIRDVFFYANRLGFLADETVMFSVAGDYSDFWRRTVLDYVQSDALAVSATTTDVATLDYAVPFNDGIMLFSGQRQFSLTNGDNGLSADTVEIKPVTNYLMSRNVRPAPIGSQVYFASDSGGNVQLQEYTRQEGSDSTDAAEVTAHVPGLVPAGITQLVAAPDLNSVIVLRSGHADAYPYQFFWNGNEKVQSAWRTWDFEGGQVISGTYFDGKLSMLMKRGSNFSIEAMDLRPTARTLNQGTLIHLDRSVTLTGTYDPIANRTVFTFPYSYDPTKVTLIRGTASPHPDSLMLGVRFDGATSVSVPGNETGFTVTGGETYGFRFQFSRQYPLDYQGRPLTTGRLQITNFSVVYTDTGFFQTEVKPYGPDVMGVTPSVTNYSGRLLGTASYRLGQITYQSGSHTFSVGADAKLATIAITSRSPYPLTLVSAEWEGKFFNRAL